MICKFARKGMTPSQIGVLLRDQHGVPLVSTVTSSKILRVLKGTGLAPEIPEDLYFLIKKAGEQRGEAAEKVVQQPSPSFQRQAADAACGRWQVQYIRRAMDPRNAAPHRTLPAGSSHVNVGTMVWRPPRPPTERTCGCLHPHVAVCVQCPSASILSATARTRTASSA